MHNFIFNGIAGVRLLTIAAFLTLGGPALAATLVLQDGSVIQGEIKSLQDDIYTIETQALGTVRVRKQNVRTIDHGGGSTAPSSAGALSVDPAELQALQSRMMQNASLFSMIEALQNDPEVQAVLSDPEIMEAIASGNLTALMNHPKIIALTRNPNMRDVIDEAQ